MTIPARRAPPTVAAMYRAIVGVGMFCALLVVGVFQATAARIADNEARALRKAVAAVLPAAVALRPIAILADGEIAVVDASTQKLPAFAGYDADGKLVGAAITAVGMGYQDAIEVIYSYSYADTAVVGMRVLQSLETPGLGDRIETDPDFVANFRRLDVTLTADGNALANALATVPHGSKEHPWQIDAITGATVSSNAIGRILDASAQTWVPLLERYKNRLARVPAPAED